MSHLTSSLITITDLDILRKAIAGLSGLKWNEGARVFNGVKTFTSYYCHEKSPDSGSVLEEQIKAVGQLEHSISIDVGDGNKNRYEIGVVRKNDGEGWVLLFDPYDTRAAQFVGAKCEKVMSEYAAETVRDFASRNGYLLEHSVDSEGNITMVMTDSN